MSIHQITIDPFIYKTVSGILTYLSINYSKFLKLAFKKLIISFNAKRVTWFIGT